MQEQRGVTRFHKKKQNLPVFILTDEKQIQYLYLWVNKDEVQK